MNTILNTTGGQGTELFAPAPGAGPLPMLQERAECLRSLGENLTRLKLTPLGLVHRAQGSAVAFVDALVKDFPLYADVSGNSSTPLYWHR